MLSHLINQQICHEILALQIANFLISKKSIKGSIDCLDVLLCRTGRILEETSSKATNKIFDQVRIMLQEGTVDRYSQQKIEKLLKTRKKGFYWHKTIDEGLDLVEKNDRVTHTMQLNDKIDIEETLNKYQFDDNFLKNEESWNNIRKSILGITDEDSNNDSSDDGDSSSDSDDGSTGDDEEVIRMTMMMMICHQ